MGDPDVPEPGFGGRLEGGVGLGYVEYSGFGVLSHLRCVGVEKGASTSFRGRGSSACVRPVFGEDDGSGPPPWDKPYLRAEGVCNKEFRDSGRDSAGYTVFGVCPEFGGNKGSVSGAFPRFGTNGCVGLVNESSHRL